MDGIFVTFEGIEACGKSTQLMMLANWLLSDGHEIVVTREPGGTALGEKIRDLLKNGNKDDIYSSRAEILLFEASRAQHVHEKISPAIESGKIVLCDRFCDSTVVYQGAARNIDGDVIKYLNDFASNGIQPDFTMFLDITVDESIRRISDRNFARDRIEQENNDFFEKVRMGYQNLSKTDERFFSLDGHGDVKTIHEAIRNEFTKRFF